MVSAFYPDEFYLKLKQVCEMILSSHTNFIVSSIGKQSLGKSYFLNKIFDSRIQTKDGKLVSKGTQCFEYVTLKDFHLLDMEGLESTESCTVRDAFNFFSIMSISDLVLLHISHSDLENRMFIKKFAFLIYQCFSPCKSTCYSYRLYLPRIILLIKDPRWEDEEGTRVWNKYQELVQNFQKEILDEAQGFTNELLDMLLEAELKNEKDKEKQREIEKKYQEIKSTRIDFKIDEFFPVYFQQTGFGRNKQVDYYKLKVTSKSSEIKKSKFKFLLKRILAVKNKPSTNFDDPFSNNQNFSEFQGIEGFHQIIEIMRTQKAKEESIVSIISNIYIDIKNDIFFNRDNVDQLKIFISKFYKIKKSLEEIIKSAHKSVELKEVGNYVKSFFSNDKSSYLSEIKAKTEETFDKIIEKNGLNGIKEELTNYFRLILVKRFNEIFSLDPKKPDSILYAALFSILNFKKQKKINEQLENISKQIQLFQCLWLFDKNFKKILKPTFTRTFKYFDCIIELMSQNMKLIQMSLSKFNKKLVDLPCKVIDLSKLKENFTNFFNPFSEFTLITSDCFEAFSDGLERISNLKMVRFSKDDSLTVLNDHQKVEILVIEKALLTKSLIYSLFPSISGLLTGIISIGVRCAIIAAAETAAAAAATAAATAWIPIVGWVIFGVTTLVSLGWFGYTVYKLKKPRVLKKTYLPPADYFIKDAGFVQKVVNGTISEENFNKKFDRLEYYSVLKKGEDVFYSAFAKVIIVILLEKKVN